MKRFISILLTIIFASYTVCTTSFIHSHIVDGQLITHSHPYSQQNHQHTDSSLAAFGSIQHSVYDSTQQQWLPFATEHLLEIIYDYATPHTHNITHINTALRAPPVC